MTERCKHEMLPGECGLCTTPPSGINRVVYFTSASRAFHNDPRCKALLAGQDFAVDVRNQQKRRIEGHSWVEGIAALDPCKVCCSAQQAPTDAQQVNEEVANQEIAKTLIESWRELKQSYPEHLIFIQCGCFLEAYEEDAEKLQKVRGAKVFTRGDRKIAGVPISSKQAVIDDMEAAGHLVLAYEEIAWAGDRKQRGISHATRTQESSMRVGRSDGAPVSKASRARAEKTKTTIEEAKKLRASTNVDVVLTEYGNMFNAFDDDAQLLSDRIGLKSFTRYGHLTVGFPLISKDVYFQKILDEGISFSTRTTKEVNGEKVRAFGSRYVPSNMPSRAPSNSNVELATGVTTTQKSANEERPTTPLERALYFASCGFYVLPLKPGAKTPLISDWPKRATTNRLQIEAWWQEHPTANVGLACEVSNLIVVDLDVSKSEKPPANWATKGALNGEDVLRLEATNSTGEDVFDTYSVVTPSGGKHLYFFDEGQPIKQGVEVNGLWKVDTRSKGGYIVAAGSSVLASLGELREYKAIGSPTKMRPLPRWLRERLTPRQPAPSTWSPSTTRVSSSTAHAILADRCRQMATTTQGRRNNELLRHASYLGRVIATGALNEPEVRSRLLAAAITSGLSEVEAKYTLDRGVKWGQNPT